MVSLFARDAQGDLGPIAPDDYLSLKTQLDHLAILGAVRETEATIALDGRESVMSVAAITTDLAARFQLADLAAASASRALSVAALRPSASTVAESQPFRSGPPRRLSAPSSVIASGRSNSTAAK